MREMWDVLDRGGYASGRLHERGKPLPPGAYHLIVDVWVLGNDGRYLVTRRCPDKHPFAGLWEPTCGCAQAGDTSLAAALRETREEVGLSLHETCGTLLGRLIDDTYQYILDVWLFRQDISLQSVVLQQGETDRAALLGKDEILGMQQSGEFIGKERIPYIADWLPGKS